VDRAVTIALGEMYLKRGISERRRVTRSWVDKSSLSNAGNGMPYKKRSYRLGADPPKNESGMTAALSSYNQSHSFVSAGNGSWTAVNSFNSKFGTWLMLIVHTRLCCWRAEMMLATPLPGDGE
jgi:hypothetical protein